MSNIYNLTAAHANYLFQPLKTLQGVGICNVCFGIKTAGYENCFQCNAHQECGHKLASAVIPISVAIENSNLDVLDQFPHELRIYKDPLAKSAYELRIKLAALLMRTLNSHEVCFLRAGSQINENEENNAPKFDIVTSIPSTRGRLGIHPLRDILENLIPTTKNRYLSTVKYSGTPGIRRGIDINRFKLDVAESIVEGKTILLIDDTWTSGANAQSAAAKLQEAGASSVVILVMGRWFSAPNDPKYIPDIQNYISEITKSTWDWDDCLVHI